MIRYASRADIRIAGYTEFVWPVERPGEDGSPSILACVKNVSSSFTCQKYFSRVIIYSSPLPTYHDIDTYRLQFYENLASSISILKSRDKKDETPAIWSSSASSLLSSLPLLWWQPLLRTRLKNARYNSQDPIYCGLWWLRINNANCNGCKQCVSNWTYAEMSAPTAELTMTGDDHGTSIVGKWLDLYWYMTIWIQDWLLLGVDSL